MKKKKKGKKKQGSRKAPFWSLDPGGRRAPCMPELRPFEGAAPDLRRGARVGSRVALRLRRAFHNYACYDSLLTLIKAFFVFISSKNTSFVVEKKNWIFV